MLLFEWIIGRMLGFATVGPWRMGKSNLCSSIRVFVKNNEFMRQNIALEFMHTLVCCIARPETKQVRESDNVCLYQ